jgi:hypothetical protein
LSCEKTTKTMVHYHPYPWVAQVCGQEGSAPVAVKGKASPQVVAAAFCPAHAIALAHLATAHLRCGAREVVAHAPQAAASARTPVTGPCSTFTLVAPRIGQVGLHSSSQRSQPQASESNLSIGRDRFCRGRALPLLAVGRSPPPLSTRGSKREVSANLKARSKGWEARWWVRRARWQARHA